MAYTDRLEIVEGGSTTLKITNVWRDCEGERVHVYAYNGAGEKEEIGYIEGVAEGETLKVPVTVTLDPGDYTWEAATDRGPIYPLAGERPPLYCTT